MIYAGAKNETETQISKVLNFDSNQKAFHENFQKLIEHQYKNTRSIKLQTANSFWMQKDLKVMESFVKIEKNNYNSEPKLVDFTNTETTRNEINLWVENKTKNKIKELIQPTDIGKETRLVLVNAIYFYADWQVGFNKKQTYESQFTFVDKQEKKVPFMHTTFPFNYFSDESIQAVELPYKDGQASMIIILPKVFNELNQFEKLFDFNYYHKIISNFSKDTVVLSLPKFKNSARFQLNKTLSEIGMPLAFTNNADFSGITGDKTLHISQVLHQAVIEVSEEGTEASAATAVLTKRGMLSTTKNFNANQPFIYIIKDNSTGSILFIGKVNNPLEN